MSSNTEATRVFALRNVLRFAAAAIIAISAGLALACSDTGQHDSGEQAGDPSTQPNGTVKPDSSTQNAISPGVGATATGTSTGTTTGTSAPR